MRQGKLICVSGLTGAGKTTLIKEALQRIDNIEVLLTYTTRPMRPGEENSYEYLFVDEEAYQQAKRASGNWDETVYNGYCYASNAETFIHDLAKGVNVIVAVTPNMDDIRLMAEIYETKPVTIWINTDAKTAYGRIAADSIRNSRIEDGDVKAQFDIIYEPSGVLSEDGESFAKLIKRCLTGEAIPTLANSYWPLSRERRPGRPE